MLAASLFVACDRSKGGRSAGGAPGAHGPAAREVVVYCSADAPVAQPVFDAFEKKTGVKVKAVFDTEATKTTGLVNRLLAEHEAGKGEHAVADVWWSSEPFGSIRLGRAGVLAQYFSGPAEKDFTGSPTGGWPRELRGRDEQWYGFARRVRVVIYNTKFVKDEDVPRDLYALTSERFKDRIGMARPEFGTTRGHMAAIYSLGENVLRNWLDSLAGNGLRLFNGNAAVARAVGNGEIWAGLTDSDDALQAKANGWPIGFVVVSNVPERMWRKRAYGAAGPDQEAFPEGSFQIPNTVALIRGAPHPNEGGILIDFLLSRECETMLAEGEGHNLSTPRGSDLDSTGRLARGAAGGSGPFEKQRWMLSELDLERAADGVEKAMGVCGEVLKGR
jgi:iron(III) transport system substrate-binding protein